MDLESNEYLESLRDKVAADLYVKRMTGDLDETTYQRLLKEAELRDMAFEDFVANRCIDLANSFITNLRIEKADANK